MVRIPTPHRNKPFSMGQRTTALRLSDDPPSCGSGLAALMRLVNGKIMMYFIYPKMLYDISIQVYIYVTFFCIAIIIISIPVFFI